MCRKIVCEYIHTYMSSQRPTHTIFTFYFFYTFFRVVCYPLERLESNPTFGPYHQYILEREQVCYWNIEEMGKKKWNTWMNESIEALWTSESRSILRVKYKTEERSDIFKGKKEVYEERCTSKDDTFIRIDIDVLMKYFFKKISCLISGEKKERF